MSFDATWFRCPNCFSPLEPLERLVLGCESGHRFDIARQGTVTLLPPRAPRTIGDDHQMLSARAALLDSALYLPIADSVAAIATSLSGRAPEGDAVGPRLVDFGCGTGYYASRVADDTGASSVLLADRSPVAVRMATRTVEGATGVVLDIWRPLPLRDGSADLALNVFAPRNPDEYARVLRAGGVLLVVVPREEHLAELRRDGSVLAVPPDKERAVSEALAAAGFDLAEHLPVRYETDVTAEQRVMLVAMGPSAHHAAAGGSEAHAPLRVTVSVDVLAFRRRPLP
ncbi:putative RNA methyltransferase [Agromyces sp. NPDC058110]|uniref:putative RNA methyltransferase n=1 Tax=Agromyces sp. NPDC058110 TaxID=3346345 RepID=UPI0036DACDB3